MPSITPFLWFDDRAEEAMTFYVSLFDDSRVLHVERYPDESLDPHFAGMSGKVITGVFQLCGRTFQCLDGGPMFPLHPAVSLYCTFPDRTSLEATWARLVEDGKTLMEYGSYPWSAGYGWLQDRYGLSWQLALDESAAEPSITPALMFTQAAAGRAEQAMTAWTSLFPDSGVDLVVRYEEGDPDTPGLVKHARFHLAGSTFTAMDSTGPHEFTFSEAHSLMVTCADQAEIDRYWDALTADGGSESQCGWCKDRFGLSWQIIPERMGDLLGAGPAAVQAMMKMQKIDIAELERAVTG